MASRLSSASRACPVARVETRALLDDRTTPRAWPRIGALVTRGVANRPGRAHERMLWLLRRMATPERGGVIVAWQEKDVDAFVRAFPEAEKALVIYSMGPNSSPMLNAAAKRAKAAGYVTAGSIGNQDARMYQQRTWCRVWRLTDAGRRLLAKGDSA